MYLIVDSGSTKTDWFAIDEKGSVLFSTQTLGLNPQVVSSAILTERIINNYDLFQNRKKRLAGIWITVLGIATPLVIYLCWVPQIKGVS